MKSVSTFVCLLLSIVLLMTGCADAPLPPDTDSGTASDSVETTLSDTADDMDADEAVFDPASDPRKGTAVNIDCDAVWYLVSSHKQNYDNLEQKCIDWFNNRYKNCGVSDILYNIDSVVPSESRKEYQDFYVDSVKNGTALDDTTTKLGRAYNTVFNELKVDPYKIWFDLCYENGINPWLSFRMNDVHAPNLGYGCDDFHYTAKENGWLIGTEAGYGAWASYCYDYSQPEVRKYYLTYLDEMMGKYDAYGIELDYMRELTCFKTTTPDNCQYMDLFMEELNKIVAKYEKQYGHEIKIMIRVSRDIEQVRYFGFDIRGWGEKDWLDVVVPSPAHGTTDSDMPIAGWKVALKGTDVQVYAGYEAGVISAAVTHKPHTITGFSAMYLQQGADKIYLYNLFNSSNTLYKMATSLEQAMKYAKRSYVVTSQNMKPAGTRFEKYQPLPMYVNSMREADPVVINHGYMDARWDSYLYIGITNKSKAAVETAGLVVKYNGVECEYKGNAQNPFIGNSDKYQCILSYKIPREAWENSTSGEISFTTSKSILVGYIELVNGNILVD